MLSFMDAAVTEVHDPGRIREVYRAMAPRRSRDAVGHAVGDDAEALIFDSMALRCNEQFSSL
jgi:hypothetical protein